MDKAKKIVKNDQTGERLESNGISEISHKSDNSVIDNAKLGETGEANLKAQEKIIPIKGRNQGKNRNFLFVYAMTLMSIAFILVLLSYFSTMRANKSQIESLKQAKEEYTVSAMKSIQSLEDENMELKEIKENLMQQLKEQIVSVEVIEQSLDKVVRENKLLKEQNEVAAEKIADLESMIKVNAAVNHINELYSKREYSRAAYEISQLEGSDKDYVRDVLSREDNNGMFDSLIDSYYNIREQLERKGYMDPEKIERWKSENIEVNTDNN